MSMPLCTPTSTAAFAPVNWLGGITSCTSAFTVAQYIADPVPVISVIAYYCVCRRGLPQTAASHGQQQFGRRGRYSPDGKRSELHDSVWQTAVRREGVAGNERGTFSR